MGNQPQKQKILQTLFSCCCLTNLCLRPELDSPQLQHFLLSYSEITLTEDPYYGLGYALKHRSGIYTHFIVKEELEPNEVKRRREVLIEL